MKVIQLELKGGNAGKRLRVYEKPLGGGKQGNVYRKKGWGKKPDQAVKIFHNCPAEAETFIKKLTAEKFPQDIPICKPLKYFHTGDGRFGYVMELKKEGFVEYKEFIQMLENPKAPSDKIPDLSVLCRVCYGLAEIVACIHEMGWVFPDLSENNFAFHPQTGQVILFDADNLRKASDAKEGKVAIRGTYGSMAPELVCGKTYPNEYTDNFALASVIFQMFIHSYPYDGNAMLEEINDAEYYLKHHGEEPVFAFSKRRPGKALPKEGYYAELWEKWNHLFPEELRRMFLRAFEDGAHSPAQRPAAREWMELFRTLARQVTYCPKCRKEFFALNISCECPNCGKIVSIPYMYVQNGTERFRIPIFRNQEICPFELEYGANNRPEFVFHDAVLPMAKLVVAQGRPYLVNLDSRKEAWICSYGRIHQKMEFGEGNLFAENIRIEIPTQRGKWVVTLK